MLIDAYPDRTFTATVAEIATTPSVAWETYEVEVRLSPTDAAIAAGTTTKAVVPQRPDEPPQPVVSPGALVHADGMSAQLYALVDDPAGQTAARVSVHLHTWWRSRARRFTRRWRGRSSAASSCPPCSRAP